MGEEKSGMSLAAFSLGFGCMRAWALMFLASSGVTQPFSLAVSGSMLAVFIPVLSAALAVLMGMSLRRPLRLLSRRAVVAGASALAVGTVLLRFAGAAVLPVADGLCALGFGLVLMQWGDVSSRMTEKRLMAALSIGFAMAALLCFFLGFLPTGLADAALVALGFASGFALLFVKGEETDGTATAPTGSKGAGPDGGGVLGCPAGLKRRGANALVRLCAAMFIMELVARSALMLSGEYFASTSSLSSSFELARLVGTVVAAVAFAAVGAWAREPLRVLYRLTPLLLVCSCLFLLFEHWGIPFVTYAIAFSAGAWLEIVFWIFFSHSHRRLDYPASFVWGAGRVAFWVSTLVGLTFWACQGELFGGSLVTQGGVVTTLVIVMALLTMVVYLLVLPEEIVKTIGLFGQEDRAPQPPNTVEQAVEVLAEESGLSKREREVLGLLARGRSTAYIQNQLFISSGTVCSHRDRIYRKLDVHSKQELLDLIDEQLGS